MSTALALSFEGQPISILRTPDNAPMWRAKEISVAVGYANARQLSDNIRRAWSDELDEGADYVVATAKYLKSLKCVDSTHLDFSPRGEIVLTEQGLFGVINLAKTDMGRRFRKWIRSEVLPAIANKGTYSAPNAPAQGDLFADAPVVDVKERRRQIEAAAKAKNAEARLRAATLREQEAQARFNLDREIALRRAELDAQAQAAEVSRATAQMKLRAALEVLGDEADALTKLKALGWAFECDVTPLMFESTAAHLREVTQPALPIAVVNRTGWLSASGIARIIKNPAIDNKKVGSAISALGIKGTDASHLERKTNKEGSKYDLWTYSPDAVKRIVAYITGGK